MLWCDVHKTIPHWLPCTTKRKSFCRFFIEYCRITCIGRRLHAFSTLSEFFINRWDQAPTIRHSNSYRASLTWITTTKQFFFQCGPVIHEHTANWTGNQECQTLQCVHVPTADCCCVGVSPMWLRFPRCDYRWHVSSHSMDGLYILDKGRKHWQTVGNMLPDRAPLPQDNTEDPL